MTTTKRRAENFTLYEQNLVVNCIKEEIGEIECKKTDTKSTREKKEAWQRVSKAFNKNPHVTQRDEIQLHNLWDRLKKAAKREAGQDLRERRKTGGGPYLSKLTDLSCKIRSMIPEQIDPPAVLQNNCDSDRGDTSKAVEPALSHQPTDVIEHPLSIGEAGIGSHLDLPRSSNEESKPVEALKLPKKQVASKRPSITQSEYFSTILQIMRKESEEKMAMLREEHQVKMDVVNMKKEIVKKKLKKMTDEDATLTDISYSRINSVVNDDNTCM